MGNIYGTFCKKELLDNGKSIDLSESPLYYGEKANISSKIRTILENIELKYYNSPIEYARLVNSKGKIIQDAIGDIKSVKTRKSSWQKSYAMTHIHPRQIGWLGGTFSEQDIIVFCNYSNVKIMRAAAKEGTYSIIKQPNFKKEAFKKYYHEEAENLMFSSSEKFMLESMNKYLRGEITYEEYEQEYDKDYNRFIVGKHNILIMGQTRFNYNYTLEER